MLQPTDMNVRRLIAAERIERLRRDAWPAPPRVAGPVRRRAGAFLVASGLRLGGQCTGDGHALCLSSGELSGSSVGEMFCANGFKPALRGGACGGSGLSFAPGGVGDVGGGAHVREQKCLLR